MITAVDCTIARTSAENSADFIVQCLSTPGYFKWVNTCLAGGTRQRISRSMLANYDVMVPPTAEEQKQIGAYFKSFDCLIALHQRKCFSLKILCHYEIFITWEQRKLGEIAEIIGGGTPSTNNPTYWDGDIDWYTPAEIGEQIFANESIRKITKEGLNHCSAKILPAYKTVLFTSRAGIGKMAILQHPATTNQGFQSLVCHNDIAPYFVFSMGNNIKAGAERVAAGSTFAEISGKKLSNLEFMFPDTAEQQAIGAYFKNFDMLIALHQRKANPLKMLVYRSDFCDSF